ncbi:unnamed protein product [Closterium sp. Yama58-4]|nr:unnamed protein product [Closterium sp. Yama58-4]
MDVWGPAPVPGPSLERYFLLVVDNYTRYTTVFLLQRKGDVRLVLIPWIRAVRRQLSARFDQDLPVLRLHSDRGGEFSSNLLEDFCRDEGITQSFTLPASPQQNGIAERRIGLVMEVARTTTIHAASPHFLLPFAVRYAAHQLNLWPPVSEPETSSTLRWTGEVGDASAFQIWGSIALVRNTTISDKLSSRTPVVVDSGAAGGGGAGGIGFGGAGAGGANLGGTESGGAALGGGQQLPSRPQETLSLQQLRESADSGGAERGGGQPLPSRPRETLAPQQRREWVVGRRADSAGVGFGVLGVMVLPLEELSLWLLILEALEVMEQEVLRLLVLEVQEPEAHELEVLGVLVR